MSHDIKGKFSKQKSSGVQPQNLKLQATVCPHCANVPQLRSKHCEKCGEIHYLVACSCAGDFHPEWRETAEAAVVAWNTWAAETIRVGKFSI